MRTTKLGNMVEKLKKDPIFWAEEAKTDFTEEVYRIMAEQNIDEKELADRLKISQYSLSKILSNDNVTTIEFMSIIALALGGKIKISIIPINENK